MDPVDRLNEFERYIAEINNQAKRDLLQLFKETGTLTNAESGSEYAKNMSLLVSDRRWNRMDCIHEVRQKLFLEYIRKLSDTIPSLQTVIDTK
jgi:hypothetical protein